MIDVVDCTVDCQYIGDSNKAIEQSRTKPTSTSDCPIGGPGFRLTEPAKR